MNVQVNIVTYNSAAHIAKCITSVISQTHPCSILVIDNNSTDDTLANIRDSTPNVRVISNTENAGFAKAHNQGIHDVRSTTHEKATNTAVLILNPDVILQHDYVERLVHHLEANPKCGIASGRLYRLDDRPDIIDSDGLAIRPSLQAYDRHAGMQASTIDNAKEDIKNITPERVFGVSGAACMIRLSALDKIAHTTSGHNATKVEEYFDETFFLYKEDVDLCWRLWHAGFDANVVYDAIGHHVRGVKTNPKPTTRNLFELIESRRHRSRAEQFHSFKNQHLLVVKNAFATTLLRYFFSVILHEIKLLALITIIKPSLFPALIATIKLLPQAIKKRKHIINATRRNPAEFKALLSIK